MEIHLSTTPAEIERCYPVMVQLRPHLSQEDFIAQVLRQIESGYYLACLEDDGQVRALAGYRYYEMLSRGKFMYVDDLITDSEQRSHGFGQVLFDWLVDQARQNGCQMLNLDSAVHRFRAHRFYFTRGMHIQAYHFSLALTE